MFSLMITQRLTSVRSAGLSCGSLRLIRSGIPRVSFANEVPTLQPGSRSFHSTPFRCISQESKDKVKERNEAIKKNLTVEDRVKIIIADQLGVKIDEVVSQASFVNQLGADSLDTVELLMALEQAFGVEIPDEEAERLTTVHAATEYIKARYG